MNILTIVLLMILIMLSEGALCIACFFVGAKVGQTVSKGKDIEMPNLNPVEAYRKHKEEWEARRDIERDNIILENIEKYDGTSSGQKDVPR